MELSFSGFSRKDVHGTDPQFLIEKILRERIYDSTYWKEKLFACTAEIMVDRGADCRAIGGRYGNQKPTEFICAALKLLQLQPEIEIIEEFIRQPDEKYLTALAVFYIRLVGTSLQVYSALEPLLEDRRKLRRRVAGTHHSIDI